MIRFYRVLLTDFDAELVRDGDEAEIVLLEEAAPRSVFAYSIFFVFFLGVSHWLIDRRIPVLDVEFRSDCADGRQHYRRLFGDNLKFNAPRTRIRFNAEFLAMKPIRNEAQMKRFLRDSPQALIAQYRSRDSISARVRLELHRASPENWPGFEDLAAHLYTTSSTLRRRLEAEGASYQRIKDEVRRERAIEQLRRNQKSNAEIAEELGFGDPSTFYRAFRKWTGATPNAFRRPVRAVA
jgi:AraC-like DNA-binding protein